MPTTLAALLIWLTNHLERFTASQAQIGISTSQLAAFKTLVDAFVAAEADAQTQREKSKSATQGASDAQAAVRAYGQALIGIIRSHAETTHNPNVLVLAGLDPIAPPSVLPAPVAPDNLSVTLENNGGLRLKWKVGQPTGVTNVQYQVRRKLAGETAFTTVGIAGSKKTFLDESIPFGTDALVYQIVPFRGDIQGAPSTQFTFQFGTGGGNLTINADHGDNAAKLAA